MYVERIIDHAFFSLSIFQLLADFHMQTNIPIQTVLIHKLRSISKPIIRLAKETGCAPEILLTYHTILSKRPQLEQSTIPPLNTFF